MTDSYLALATACPEYFTAKTPPTGKPVAGPPAGQLATPRHKPALPLATGRYVGTLARQITR